MTVVENINITLSGEIQYSGAATQLFLQYFIYRKLKHFDDIAARQITAANGYTPEYMLNIS